MVDQAPAPRVLDDRDLVVDAVAGRAGSAAARAPAASRRRCSRVEQRGSCTHDASGTDRLHVGVVRARRVDDSITSASGRPAREPLPHRRRHRPDHDRVPLAGAGRRRAVRRAARELGAATPATRPARERGVRRIEPLQAVRAIGVARRDVDVLDQPRDSAPSPASGRSATAIRAGEALAGFVQPDRAGRSGRRASARDRSPARRRSRACPRRRRHALAFRVADLPEPPVLQRREQHDQPEQGRRDDEHRQPESAPHAAESSTQNSRRNRARAAGFTCLTNS